MVLRFEERLAERSRIGRELHDTLLQNIAGFALQLEGLAKTVTGPPSARLRELRAQAEQWLREARESVWDLRSPALEGRNFLSALEETAGQMIQGKDAHFQLTVCGKRRPAQPRVEEQLLRILQEATRNAVNHAQARHIQVNVAYLNGKTIQIQMRDDGCGFDLGQASRKEGHYGLATMRERASQIGADFKISSIPGQGTEIDILVKNTRWKK